MHGLTRPRGWVYVTAAIISIALSIWASIREVVVNPDAICYLQSAASMNLGLHTAMHLCDQAVWPFYSLLIYAVASVTHCSYITSAYCLNGIFSLISVLSFITIIHYLKNSSRILWLGALVILAAHEFNSVRVYIVRDHGFWAFYLVSILSLLRYFQTQQYRYALAWGLSCIVATLFRVEGAIFLLALPFVAFLLSGQSLTTRLFAFIKLNTFALIGLSFVGVWLLTHADFSATQLGRLGEIQFQIQHGLQAIAERFQANADVFAQKILSPYAAHDAKLILVLLLSAWYVFSVVSNVSFIYAILVVYAWCRSLLPSQQSARLVLWGYVAVNVVVTALFLVENMFISKRYLLALSLTLMLWVPFVLDYFCDQWRTRKWPLIVSLVLIAFYGVGGIFEFGHSKRFIHDAGYWLDVNASPAAKIYSNDYQVMYYSRHFGNDIFEKGREFASKKTIAGDQWQQFDYIAWRKDKQDVAGERVAKEWGTPVQVFKNKRGDEVAIYKIH